jgi:cyanate permease
MEAYLQGMLTGIFLGIGVGAALVWQASHGWIQALAALAGVAILAFLQYQWFLRQPQEVA